MPKKCNDHDLVIYSELKPTKGPAPLVPPIPDFKPFVYFCKQNTPCISNTIDSSDPEALFNLFFDTSVITMFITATNKNAELKRAKKNKELTEKEI